jgi:hypothetical protein
VLKYILKYLKDIETYNITLKGEDSTSLVIYIDTLFADYKELRRLILVITIFYYRTPLYFKTAR